MLSYGSRDRKKNNGSFLTIPESMATSSTITVTDPYSNVTKF
jgi:hypothetical protein